MRARVIFLAVMIVPAVSVASNWKLVAQDSKRSAFVDVESVVLVGDGKYEQRKAWIKYVSAVSQAVPPYARDAQKTHLRYTADVELNYFRCRERTVSVHEVIFYSAVGDAVGTWSYQPSAYSLGPAETDVPPDTFAEVVLKEVCTMTLEAPPGP